MNPETATVQAGDSTHHRPAENSMLIGLTKHPELILFRNYNAENSNSQSVGELISTSLSSYCVYIRRLSTKCIENPPFLENHSGFDDTEVVKLHSLQHGISLVALAIQDFSISF